MDSPDTISHDIQSHHNGAENPHKKEIEHQIKEGEDNLGHVIYLDISEEITKTDSRWQDDESQELRKALELSTELQREPTAEAAVNLLHYISSNYEKRGQKFVIEIPESANRFDPTTDPTDTDANLKKIDPQIVNDSIAPALIEALQQETNAVVMRKMAGFVNARYELQHAREATLQTIPPLTEAHPASQNINTHDLRDYLGMQQSADVQLTNTVEAYLTLMQNADLQNAAIAAWSEEHNSHYPSHQEEQNRLRVNDAQVSDRTGRLVNELLEKKAKELQQPVYNTSENHAKLEEMQNNLQETLLLDDNRELVEELTVTEAAIELQLNNLREAIRTSDPRTMEIATEIRMLKIEQARDMSAIRIAVAAEPARAPVRSIKESLHKVVTSFLRPEDENKKKRAGEVFGTIKNNAQALVQNSYLEASAAVNGIKTDTVLGVELGLGNALEQTSDALDQVTDYIRGGVDATRSETIDRLNEAADTGLRRAEAARERARQRVTPVQSEKDKLEAEIRAQQKRFRDAHNEAKKRLDVMNIGRLLSPNMTVEELKRFRDSQNWVAREQGERLTGDRNAQRFLRELLRHVDYVNTPDAEPPVPLVEDTDQEPPTPPTSDNADFTQEPAAPPPDTDSTTQVDQGDAQTSPPVVTQSEASAPPDVPPPGPNGHEDEGRKKKKLDGLEDLDPTQEQLVEDNIRYRQEAGKLIKGGELSDEDVDNFGEKVKNRLNVLLDLNDISERHYWPAEDSTNEDDISYMELNQDIKKLLDMVMDAISNKDRYYIKPDKGKMKMLNENLERLQGTVYDRLNYSNKMSQKVT